MDGVGCYVQQVPSLDLSENMSAEMVYAAAELNGTMVQPVPRSETRRNRSCRVTTTPHRDAHSQSHSRHRNTRPPPTGNKENFIIPSTPKTPRQKQRPTTIGAPPSSPPACLTTTLPLTTASQWWWPFWPQTYCTALVTSAPVHRGCQAECNGYNNGLCLSVTVNRGATLTVAG